VHVVGHQYVRVDSATFPQTDLAQFIQIADVVNLPEKQG
jgi:hypothetical protein